MNKTGLETVQERLMHSLVSFLLIGLTTTSVLAKPHQRNASSRQVGTRTVLVLGDSLSAGYGLSRADAYPALLAEKAAAAGERVHIINAGVSGDTTAGAVRRLPNLLHNHHIDVLLIELGINDAFRGIPGAQIEANLQRIIDQTRARYPTVQIVIAGMQLPNYSQEDYLTAFGALYVELARRNHAELVPFLLERVIGNPSLNLPDLIHPNARGQSILAANVWPALEAALKKSKQS
jgi:acyl-CoA thioesterase-1